MIIERVTIYIYMNMSGSRHHILAISPAVKIYRVGDNKRTVNTLTTPHISDQLGTENACKTLLCWFIVMIRILVCNNMYQYQHRFWSFHHNPILPACTTATAHKLAFEFDLVIDVMAIFSNKQAVVSTGVTTYDMTVYKVWKHVAWSKHVMKLWQYVEHPTGWMSFAWHSFDHRSNKDIQMSPTTMRWLLTPKQKTNLLSVSMRSTILYH